MVFLMVGIDIDTKIANSIQQNGMVGIDIVFLAEFRIPDSRCPFLFRKRGFLPYERNKIGDLELW